MRGLISKYREIWAVDFEFNQERGGLPEPICLVAIELKTGKKIRLWEDDLRRLPKPPFSIDEDCLFVAYYASAELGCHLTLGWGLPVNVLDLYVEFRNLTNGLPLSSGGAGLLGALAWYGLPSISAIEKTKMQALAMRGGPWSAKEKSALLDYCETDVAALSELLPRMAPDIDMRRALIRGRYMKATAHIERNGIPIDTDAFGLLKDNWLTVKDRLIAEVDKDYSVYDGKTFKYDRWNDFLIKNGIPWTRLQSGRLALDETTFKEMEKRFPIVKPIRELRFTLSQMNLSEFPV